MTEINRPEDILTIRGWYSTPDPDDKLSILVKTEDHKLITKVSSMDGIFSIIWGTTIVALPTLTHAFSWLAQAMDLDGIPEDHPYQF
jgi:hypothetical protein